MRFPTTLRGWWRLLLITLRRCPYCGGGTNVDAPFYDRDKTMWCFPCGIVPLPRGFFEALRQNAKACDTGRGGR